MDTRLPLLLVAFAVLLIGEACSVPTATETPSSEAAPTVADRIRIAYEESGQIELMRANGSRILIDVWNSASLSKAASPSDVLLLTHSEREDLAFQNAFPGPKLITEGGEIQVGDLAVVSIEGSHTDEAPVAGAASNYILVFEVDGFRIADLGENGEERLSPAQLAALGGIDIAICPLTNTGGLDDTGRKALDVIAQFAPKLVIASFTDLDTAKAAAAGWPVVYSAKPSVEIPRTALKEGTTVLFLGQMADNYGTLTSGTPVDW